MLSHSVAMSRCLLRQHSIHESKSKNFLIMKFQNFSHQNFEILNFDFKNLKVDTISFQMSDYSLLCDNPLLSYSHFAETG